MKRNNLLKKTFGVSTDRTEGDVFEELSLGRLLDIDEIGFDAGCEYFQLKLQGINSSGCARQCLLVA